MPIWHEVVISLASPRSPNTQPADRPQRPIVQFSEMTIRWIPWFNVFEGLAKVVGVVSWSTAASNEGGCGGLTGVTPLSLYYPMDRRREVRKPVKAVINRIQKWPVHHKVGQLLRLRICRAAAGR